MNKYILKDLYPSCLSTSMAKLPLDGYIELVELYKNKIRKELSEIDGKISDIKSVI